MKRITIFLCLLFSLYGCSIMRIKSEEVTNSYYPAKPSAEAVVYLQEVSRPHEILGFVTINTERSQKMEEVIAKMKHEAAILGGDAISNITVNATGAWKKVPPQKLIGNAYIRANYSATVVAYK